MIVDPVNDADCLGQLTTIARELAPTTLVRLVARHLGTREGVIEWIQAKPQADDDGREPVQYIRCDVPQRVRLFADDPNCVERATDAAMLLEALEQMNGGERTPRALATVDHPMRHTGLVEERGGRWYAVDLFPRANARRNATWIEQVAGGVQSVHRIAGKPILQFWLGQSTGGTVADAIGGGENVLIAKVTKPKPAEEKQPPPSVAAVAQRAQPGAAGTSNQPSAAIAQGGTSGSEKETRQPSIAGGGGLASAQRARTDGDAGRANDETTEGDDYDPYDERAGVVAQRGWGGSGWWGL